jgi:hypothetical protein
MAKVYLESYLCPHCETKCSFYGIGIGNSLALYCNSCRKGAYFKLRENWDIPENCEDIIHLKLDAVEDSYPMTVVKVDQAIPPDIADDFKEAKICVTVGAKKATVTMCRRVLQNTCISKRCDPKADLVDQIDELEDKRIIKPSMKEVAHTIRKIGNWGAHPQNDPLKDVTIEDALELLNFTSEFLDEIFVSPARLEALRKKKGIK